MMNFRKTLLLLFILFLISVTSAQKFDRSYLRTSNLFDQEIDTNPNLSVHYSNIQNVLEPGTLQLDSIHTFSVSGSEAKWIYDFDEDGKLNSKMTKSYTNNAWNNWLYFTYAYDSNKYLISTFTKSWKIDQWVNYMLETYTYNIEGNVTEHLTKFWINDEWVNINKASYYYDSNENLEILSLEDWKDSSWVNDLRLLFSNLIEGNPEALIYEHWNGEEWEQLTQSVFMYNENNKLVNTVITKLDGTFWKYYLQAIFEYDLNGNLIKELHQFWDEDHWVDDGQYFFEYNSENYFTYGYSEMWNGTQWEQFDGMFSFTNPDGFTEHLWTHEAKAYYSTTTEVNDEDTSFPDQLELSQNYPNPFNPSTTISYQIPTNVKGEMSNVSLVVYDVLGREVVTLVNEEQSAGSYDVQFDASHLTSGIYFYKLQAGTFSESKKMIILK